MNAIRFWRDVWRGRPGARPIAWGIAAFAVVAVVCQIAGLND